MAATKEQIRKISEWQKDHTVTVALRLQRSTDADIIEALEAMDGSRMGAVKQLIREGLEARKQK